MADDILTRMRVIAQHPFDRLPLDCSIEAADAAAEIERLRRDGDFLLHSLQWAMQGRFIPEDMADAMDSWKEARRGRSEATEIVETMLEAGMEW